MVDLLGEHKVQPGSEPITPTWQRELLADQVATILHWSEPGPVFGCAVAIIGYLAQRGMRCAEVLLLVVVLALFVSIYLDDRRSVEWCGNTGCFQIEWQPPFVLRFCWFNYCDK